MQVTLQYLVPSHSHDALVFYYSAADEVPLPVLRTVLRSIILLLPLLGTSSNKLDPLCSPKVSILGGSRLLQRRLEGKV